MAPFLCTKQRVIFAAGLAAAVGLAVGPASDGLGTVAAPAQCTIGQSAHAYSLTCAPAAPAAPGAPSEQTITDTNPGILSPSHGGAFANHPLL